MISPAVLTQAPLITPPPAPTKPLIKKKTPAQEKAEKLSKALKQCKQDKYKAKRKTCETQAHKRYGPKTKSKPQIPQERQVIMRISFLSSLVSARPDAAGPATSLNARKLTLITLATLCALTGVLALGSTSASAYLKHEYISQITGTPEGSFNNLCGVTVDPASQDIYAPNFENTAPEVDVVVNIFSSSNVYKSHVGGLAPAANEFTNEFCDTAVSDVTGDVYVADRGTRVVYVFGALGNYLETIDGSSTPKGPFAGDPRVAVDQTVGDVYITNPGAGVVDRFNSANEYESQVSGLSNPEGLAVASSGDFYVADSGEHAVQEFDSSGTAIGRIADTNLQENAMLALDTAGNVYVTRYGVEGAVEELSSSGAFEGQILPRHGNTRQDLQAAAA